MEVCLIINDDCITGIDLLDTGEYAGRRNEGNRWIDDGKYDGDCRNTDGVTACSASSVFVGDTEGSRQSESEQKSHRNGFLDRADYFIFCNRYLYEGGV